MPKKLVVVLVLAVVIVVSGVFVVAQKPAEQPAQSTNTTAAPAGKPSETKPEKTTMPTAGTYADYSEATLAESTGTRLLFFHASWCPQCRALEADIKATGVPEDVTILKVDYDSNQKLRQKYGVTIQTTVVRIAEDGTLVEKYVAYDNPTIQHVKDALL